MKEINNKTIPNFFIRSSTRVGSWFTSSEDKLFAAAVVNHLYETEETPSAQEAEKTAREFDAATILARKECKHIWWIIFMGLVVIPHVSTVVGFSAIALVLKSVVTGDGGVPYAFLFYGALAVVLLGIYFSKVVLDDLNPKVHNRVLARWHQVLTALEMLAVTLFVDQMDSVGMAMLSSCLMELGYLICLCVALRALPFGVENPSHFVV